MRKCKIFHRSTATIVQQENGQTAKDVIKSLGSSSGLDINPGSQARSYDCEAQDKVDFGKPIFDGFEDLIDQHMSREKIFEHLHPQAPKDPPTPPEDPSAPEDPSTPPAE